MSVRAASSFLRQSRNELAGFLPGSNSEAQAFLQRDGQVIIRMRGLPFDATAKDVVSRRFPFLEQNSCVTHVVYEADTSMFALQTNRVSDDVRYARIDARGKI